MRRLIRSLVGGWDGIDEGGGAGGGTSSTGRVTLAY